LPGAIMLEDEQSGGRRRLWALLIAVFGLATVAIGVGFVCARVFFPPETAPPIPVVPLPASGQPALPGATWGRSGSVLTVGQFQKKYADNQLAADQEMQGKHLRLVGTIIAIEEIDGTPTLRLSAPDAHFLVGWSEPVSCAFPDPQALLPLRTR